MKIEMTKEEKYIAKTIGYPIDWNTTKYSSLALALWKLYLDECDIRHKYEKIY